MKAQPCSACKGKGRIETWMGNSPVTRVCEDCGGTGQGDPGVAYFRGPFMSTVPCTRCDGTGKVERRGTMRTCLVCQGKGRRPARPSEELGTLDMPTDPDAIRRMGGVQFHRWLAGHLLAVTWFPAVFPGDGLIDIVPDWGDVSERETGERESNRTLLAIVACLDDRDWWDQESISDEAVREVRGKQKTKRKADKARRAGCRPDSAAASIPDWYLKLTPETIARVEAAEAANRSVTGESIADWYFAHESGNEAEREYADTVLVYLTQFPREPRVCDAIDCIKDRLRAAGAPCPWSLVDFRPVSGSRSKRIRDAFIRAACVVVEADGLPVASANGETDDGATVVADIFAVSPETAARAGIKHRYDQEFRA